MSFKDMLDYMHLTFSQLFTETGTLNGTPVEVAMDYNVEVIGANDEIIENRTKATFFVEQVPVVKRNDILVINSGTFVVYDIRFNDNYIIEAWVRLQ